MVCLYISGTGTKHTAGQRASVDGIMRKTSQRINEPAALPEKTLFVHLQAGVSLDEFLGDFPVVS